MPITLVPPREGYSRNYRLRGKIRGIAVDETTGTSVKAVAEAIKIKREAQLLDESVHGKRVSATFSEAAVGYIESRRPGQSQRDAVIGAVLRNGKISRCLLTDFGEMLCSKIDQNAVDRVIRLRFKHVSAASVERLLVAPLVAVLNWAALRKWCDVPRFQHMPPPRPRSRWASYAEADRLLANAGPHLQPLLRFQILTGARIGESLRLRWDDVDLQGSWLIFRNTKRGKRGERDGEDRGVPLHPDLVALLANLPRPKSGDGFVFLTHRGLPYGANNRSGDERPNIKQGWGLILKRAGIEDLHLHDLRHTFATWALIAGVSPEQREKIMGHSSSAMSRRYAHVPDPLLIEVVARLPAPASVAPLPTQLRPGRAGPAFARPGRAKSVQSGSAPTAIPQEDQEVA